ncbi:collagen triple helix repeat-containing protein, partial [Cellulophaga geojensis KL-A]
STVVDNGDGTFTITDDSGNAATIDTNQVAGTLVNNNDGTITYTDGTGSSQTIGLVSSDANNDIQVGTDGGLYLNVASVTIDETITSLTDNGDGTFTYENESGAATTFDSKRSTVLDNGDGTFTITDDSGNAATIDTNNTVTTLVNNGDGSFTYTSEDGTLTNFVGTDSQDLSLTGDNLTLTNDPTATPIDLSNYRETVIGAGDINVTNDGSGNYTVAYTDGDNDNQNEIELPTGGADGQVLSTDGAGVYTWVDPDSGPQGEKGDQG